jgi:hypothetical protein
VQDRLFDELKLEGATQDKTSAADACSIMDVCGLAWRSSMSGADAAARARQDEGHATHPPTGCVCSSFIN